MTKNNNAYWREREWQLKQLKNDDKFNQELKRYYDQLIVGIKKEIDREVASLASRNETSIDNARAAVTGADISAYESEAQALVHQADLMRAAGHHVTYDDFSDEVNERMRIYNATMRINRLELLKSQIGLRMIECGMQVDQAVQDKVSKDYTDELKRQAGILNVTAKNDQLWTSSDVAKQIMVQFNGATFSQRIWANQDALKATLDAVISVGVIQGKNPRQMAKLLKDQVRATINNHRYVTERIARTESARVQHAAQVKSLTDNGYRWCKWYAEPGACRVCREIADNDNYDKGFGVYPIDEVPEIPVHPNCRCSISAFWSDKDV